MASSPIRLSALDAEIRRVRYSEDVVVSMVFFTCPLPDCEHLIGVPFSDEGGTRLDDGRPVWKRQSGSTTEDLTLTPSVHQIRPCGAHGFIRRGAWHGV